MDLPTPPPAASAAPSIRFGGFALDPTTGVVLRPDGTKAELRLKAIAVLRTLAESSGRVVSRETLMHAVWPNVFVTDDNITQCVTAIRRALGKDGAALLRTLPKRGYLLVRDGASDEAARVGDAGRNAASGGGTAQPGPSLPNRPSLVVLPFANLSGDPEQEYFSDGVTDDIIAQLARNRSLFVIARSSGFSYKVRAVSVKEIARELGIRYVLEGSVRRDGGRVRISTLLVEAETEIHIWAERYDRSLTDVFAVQDEITRAVAIAIGPAISDAERERAIRKPTADLNAWEAYQRGLWHVSRDSNDDINLGLEFFHRAVALDPLFAEAHAMLARYYVTDATRGGRRTIDDARTLAEAEARAALRLDPDNSSAYAALAWISNQRRDVAIALEQAERAIALNANDPSGHMAKGHVLVFARQPAAARTALNAALRLDPRGQIAMGVLHHFAVSCYFERDYAAAVAAAKRVIRTYPEFPRALPFLVASLAQVGHPDQARRALQDATPAARALFDRHLRSRPPSCSQEDYEHLLEGLRKAGCHG